MKNLLTALVSVPAVVLLGLNTHVRAGGDTLGSGNGDGMIDASADLLTLNHSSAHGSRPHSPS